MAQVTFTRHLYRFFPDLTEGSVPAESVAALVRALDARHPGLAGYLVDERGALRKHVNVFVDGEMVRDRRSLSDPLTDASEVFIVQALSGG
ncbi:MAG: MoaD/ThiS family protein [Alphaproteobacteria bacterium]|nr:MoaD/ThiS family protein [Alphaproteobacteria bacterium]